MPSPPQNLTCMLGEELGNGQASKCHRVHRESKSYWPRSSQYILVHIHEHPHTHNICIHAYISRHSCTHILADNSIYTCTHARLSYMHACKTHTHMSVFVYKPNKHTHIYAHRYMYVHPMLQRRISPSYPGQCDPFAWTVAKITTSEFFQNGRLVRAHANMNSHNHHHPHCLSLASFKRTAASWKIRHRLTVAIMRPGACDRKTWRMGTRLERELSSIEILYDCLWPNSPTRTPIILDS